MGQRASSPSSSSSSSSASSSSASPNTTDNDNEFWFPRSPAQDARETVVVVGAGLAGISTAMFLNQTRRFKRIVVLDSESGPALATSYANAGAMAVSSAFPKARPGQTMQLVKQVLGIGTDKRSSNANADHDKNQLPPAPPMESKVSAKGVMSWGPAFLSASNEKQFDVGCRGLYSLASFSRDLTMRMDEEIGLQLRPVWGHLSVYGRGEEAELDSTDSFYAQMNERFGIRYERLTAEQCAQREPGLAAAVKRDALLGALFFPDDVAADSRHYCTRLYDRLTKQSTAVEFHFNVEVTGFLRDEREGRIAGLTVLQRDNFFSLAMRASGMAAVGGDINTSLTSRNMDEESLRKVQEIARNNRNVQVVKADRYVLCTGDLTPDLMQYSSVMAHAPIVAIKGHSWTVPLKQGAKSPLVNHSLSLHKTHTYISSLAGDAGGSGEPDRLRITHGADLGVNHTNVRHDVRSFMKRTLRFLFPDLEVPRDSVVGPIETMMGMPTEMVGDQASIVWVGHRPVTPDGLPLIGRVPMYENLYVNSGHGMLGWTLAAGSGKLLSELMVRDHDHSESVEFSVDPAPFDPARVYSRSQLWQYRFFRVFDSAFHRIGDPIMRASTTEKQPPPKQE